MKLNPSGTHYVNLLDSTLESESGNHESEENNGVLLQTTSASVTRQRTIPLLKSYYLPFVTNKNEGVEGSKGAVVGVSEEDSAQSPLICGDGVFTFSGEITFELTEGVANVLLDNMSLFDRDSWIEIDFFDASGYMSITNCVWESITITCASNSLVTMSISYQSNNGYEDVFSHNSKVVSDMLEYDENDFLVPYWECGRADGFTEFSITFNRSVTPVFLNGDLLVASYLRPGLIETTLSATMLDFIEYPHNESDLDIQIGNAHKIILKWAKLMTMQYNMSSLSDVGTKTYTWNSISDFADDSIFTVIASPPGTVDDTK
jgi:hypothetical protein